MAHHLQHAENSARRYGGKPEEYEAIHAWFDESKGIVAGFRHRALRHHAEGVLLAERIFGAAFVNSDGKTVYTRYVGTDHVREDLGRVPSFQDWIAEMPVRSWMYGQRLERVEEL
jgi:hypothetical protein